ncbi:MAG: hypothetical protein E4H25_03000 [Methanomassiliicoccus sp.]|nr:MAG: hypothetical protein E4H25_03000 [Methanomassiliicoccus sp.]
MPVYLDDLLALWARSPDGYLRCIPCPCSDPIWQRELLRLDFRLLLTFNWFRLLDRFCDRFILHHFTQPLFLPRRIESQCARRTHLDAFCFAQAQIAHICSFYSELSLEETRIVWTSRYTGHTSEASVLVKRPILLVAMEFQERRGTDLAGRAFLAMHAYDRLVFVPLFGDLDPRAINRHARPVRLFADLLAFQASVALIGVEHYPKFLFRRAHSCTILSCHTR